jgi:hypothetical protein
MASVNSFNDELVGKTAITVDALANRGHLSGGVVLLEELSYTPSLDAVGNPATPSVRWSNPNASFAAGVVEEQGPFGLQHLDVDVANLDGSKWVDDSEAGFFENQLWSNPEQVNENAHQSCCKQVDKQKASFGWKSNGLSQKQGNENGCNCGPTQVGFGAENLMMFHVSIIASNSFDGIGKN